MAMVSLVPFLQPTIQVFLPSISQAQVACSISVSFSGAENFHCGT